MTETQLQEQQQAVPCTQNAALPSPRASWAGTQRVSMNGSAGHFMTQALKKHPRLSVDGGALKRPRVEEQDDNDDAQQPLGLEPLQQAPLEAEPQAQPGEDDSSTVDYEVDTRELDAAQHQQAQQADGSGTVFSPVFHLLKNLGNLRAAHGQGASTQDNNHLRRLPLQHEHYEDGQDEEPQDDQPDELAVVPVGVGQHHPPIIPEAVEHQQQGHEPVEEEEEDYFDFDPLLFIKQLPPLHQVVPLHRNPILPSKPKSCNLHTLVLDLDETLVHSCLEAQVGMVADFTFPVEFNNQEHVIHVRQRPHLHEFMNRVAELFEVVVFTASQKIYAEKLLNILDPERRLIKHRIFRESCVVVDGNYLKDLTVLGRDLRTTLIVDNSPQAFGFQVDNGVPIESWYDDPTDRELLKLLPFLESLVGQGDVRPAIRSRFRMKELIDGTPVC